MNDIKIDVYADETFHESQNILGICILFVPRKERAALINRIINSRCLLSPGNPRWIQEYNECPNAKKCKEQWHNNNDAEIHYKEIRTGSSHSIKSISKSWLSLIMRNNDSFMFNILYLDMNKVDLKLFGDYQSNVYNKFFRTTIKYGIKTFFAYQHVEIGNVYHDNSSALSRHGFFPNYNLSKLEIELPRLTISNKEVIFIESNHKHYADSELNKDAQLIQFTDLILGAIGQNIFYFSNDPFKKELAMTIRPMEEEILGTGYTKLRKKYYVSCFPKRELDKKLMENLKGELSPSSLGDEFYLPKIIMPRYYKKVPTLDNWF